MDIKIVGEKHHYIYSVQIESTNSSEWYPTVDRMIGILQRTLNRDGYEFVNARHWISRATPTWIDIELGVWIEWYRLEAAIEHCLELAQQRGE